MVVVLHAALQKRDDLVQLGTLDDQLRLLLATQAAGCAAFDWDIASGVIRWDGATDILPLHLDSVHGHSFLDGIAPERRDDLQLRQKPWSLGHVRAYSSRNSITVPPGDVSK